jgi:small subunit ribosomal protein S9
MTTSAPIAATGRRKTAVARVRLAPGTGAIQVNRRAFDDYFKTDSLRRFACQPLLVTGMDGKYDISVTTSGGGPMGQAGAMRHGISRALLASNVEHKPALKAAGLLTRDSRMKERKKPGQPGARKRYQFSKR